MTQIIWLETAYNTYIETLNFIYQQWSLKEVESFIRSVEDLLDNLIHNFRLCPASKKKKYRKCVINKNVSLIYSISKKNIYLFQLVHILQNS